MGLKQSIVVVNEYTIKNKSGKGGSRGGTPGDYVMRYMSRTGATEDLTPVRLQDTDSYITRYMARKEAAENMSPVGEIKKGMRAAQGYGGVAFGYGDISMSDEKLRAVSKDIQAQFDSGKTIMKTVLSFDEEYLKQHGIVDTDFELKKRGDYRGNIDQMKLRMAIMAGVEKMGRRDYDDLQFVGVIQVDTEHVHCHLAMVDKGRGNITKDGTQRGKIPESCKRELRRGIDGYLTENQPVRQMTSNITHDKRNARCFIKKYTHATMAEHGTPQFLLACLPEDKRLWRAGTNRKEMKKANSIVREYVMQVLDQPDSGYKEALAEISKYADFRRQNEDLTDAEHRQLLKNGRERVVEDCMNGVYAVLKNIPDEQRPVRTPMLDAMSMDYEEMSEEAKSDPMMEFGFKLRSYSSRLDHHKKERHKYHEAVKLYEATENTSQDSRALYQFYQVEEDYNARLMCKYQHFLSFLPPGEEYEDDFNELVKYRRRISKLKAMKDDKSCLRMSPESAEDYGKRVYDMHGGRYVATAPHIIDRRLELMQARYDQMCSDFEYKLADYGLTLDEKGVSREKPYSFDEVKSLDMHHLGYDFPYQFDVSKKNVDTFVEMANRRYDAYQGAKAYLEGSGQEYAVKALPGQDIQVMKELADRMTVKPTLVPVQPVAPIKKGRSKTVTLDADYTKDMQLAIKATVQSVQFGDNL